MTERTQSQERGEDTSVPKIDAPTPSSVPFLYHSANSALGTAYLQRKLAQRALQRRPQSTAQEAVVQRAPAAKEEFESWAPADVQTIQRELKRLGLYTIGIDHTVGEMCKAGLVEAFGGDEWRSLKAAVVLTRLKGAKPPSGKKGEHNLRYGEMFKDGVLDLTLGIGFDEGGAHKATIDGMTKALVAHGFKVDLAAATKIYAAAGRTLEKGAYGTFYVRENALTYTPPAGSARQINAVVRLVENRDGTHGAEAEKAFQDGMNTSDVSYYAGHARYGSGPDFDRNMSFEVQDDKGAWITVKDYEKLEDMLKTEGKKNGRDAWAQFLYRVDHKTIKVHGENQGNVYLNSTNQHPGEFGGKLMYWNLNQKGGAGATQATGKAGALAKRDEERKYHLWVFDGCRTQDYVKSIRDTPNQDAKKTDIIATERLTYWNDKAQVLAAFLDSVLGQQSAEQVIKGMEAQNVTGPDKSQAVGGSGFGDNPVIQ